MFTVTNIIVTRLAGSVASLYSEFFSHRGCVADGSPTTPELLGALRILAIYHVHGAGPTCSDKLRSINRFVR